MLLKKGPLLNNDCFVSCSPICGSTVALAQKSFAYIYILVDMITGKPCVDFLDDWTQWNEAYSLSSVLLAIQV